MLDVFIYTLTGLIAVLLATGGVSYSSPQLKLELSQIDAFAWALLGIVALRHLRFKAWLPPRVERASKAALSAISRHPKRAIAIAMGVYVVLMTWNSLWRYQSFRANAFDLGFVDQALWWTAHGKFLFSTMSKGSTYLGEHFAPLFAVGAIPYFLTDSIFGMFLFQSLVLASGGWLVYALARQKKVEPALAAVAAICYFAYQPLRLANAFDFREDSFFIPIFLGALLAMERRRWIWFCGLSALSWGVKENAPIFTALLGAYVALRREKPRRIEGGLLVLFSFVAFYVINTKLTPYFAGDAAQTMAVKRLRGMGNSSGEILMFMFSHPIRFVSTVAQPLLQMRALKYFLNVAVPFLIFAPVAPWAAGIVVVGIVINLLVNQPTIGFHYECILIPFLFYILTSGLAYLQKRRGYKLERTAVLTLIGFLLFFGRSPIESIRRMMPDAHHRMVAEELAKIPPLASVATQSALLPHFMHREQALLMPEPPRTDYVVVDFYPSLDRYASLGLEEYARKLNRNLYEKIIERDGLVVFRYRR